MPSIAACSKCGSLRIYPKIWVQGFLPTINAERQVYVCRDCGHEGMLLEFASEDEWRAFSREKANPSSPAPREPGRSPQAIPILPIDSVPIVQVRGVAALPIRRPKVVDVDWREGALRRGEYRVGVDEYWEAVGGSRYGAESLFVMDLSGIERGKPDFDILKFLGKRAEMWLDIGARRPEDVMDAYMVDAEVVVVGTKTIGSLDGFREVHEISEGVVPCLDLTDRVVWREGSSEEADARRVARALSGMGFPRLAVMDLRRLGTHSGPDPWLVGELPSWDTEVFLGGGVREEDLPRLTEAGLAGGLVDPFTPVIRSYLPPPKREEPAAADAAPAPEPRPDARGTPAPG